MQAQKERDNILFTFCGPSGSGKTSICEKLLERDKNLRLSISTTTRSPRGGEVDGEDYFFISKEVFKERVAAGEFIEHAVFNSKHYGTEKKNIESIFHSEQDLVLDIEVQGVAQLKKLFPNRLVNIFVFPPSWEELKNRIEGRGTEDANKIKERLDRARDEVRILTQPGFSDYLLINDNLENSVEKAEAIVNAERSSLQRITDTFLTNLFI